MVPRLYPLATSSIIMPSCYPIVTVVEFQHTIDSDVIQQDRLLSNFHPLPEPTVHTCPITQPTWTSTNAVDYCPHCYALWKSWTLWSTLHRSNLCRRHRINIGVQKITTEAKRPTIQTLIKNALLSLSSLSFHQFQSMDHEAIKSRYEDDNEKESLSALTC